MATRGKEPQPGKERRGTSQKKSCSNLKQASDPNKRYDSTTSGRNVPNYLKPTISSGIDPSKKEVKKASSSDYLSRAATVARRRSFDKPLPVSQPQKTRISPNPRERSIRSSSFTSRITTSHKPLPDRLLKASKDASKDHSVHPRPVNVKKSGLSEKKQSTEATATSGEAPRTSPPRGEVYTDVADIPQLEEQEDLSSPISEADEAMLNVGNNSAVPDEELAIVEDKLHLNLTESELKGEEVDHELKIIESSIEPKQQYEITDGKLEEPEDKLQDGEIVCSDSQLEEHGEMEKDNSHPEENAEQGPQSEIEKIEDRGLSEDLNSKTLGGEEEEEDVNITQSEVIDSPEKETTEDVTKEAQQDTDKAETKPEVLQGKKDLAPLSNDVIEETASKLREQRKNKVKALAGAFETVISLQDK